MTNQQNDCAPKEDSDGHPPSLIRVFAVTQWVAKDTSVLHEDSEDSDQSGRMPRLIRVFTGTTCHFVGFVMRRLICDVLVHSCDYFKVHQYANNYKIKAFIIFSHKPRNRRIKDLVSILKINSSEYFEL